MIESLVVMAYIDMAYVVMAYIDMAYIVMAYIVMAYVVMAEPWCTKTHQPIRELALIAYPLSAGYPDGCWHKDAQPANRHTGGHAVWCATGLESLGTAALYSYGPYNYGLESVGTAAFGGVHFGMPRHALSYTHCVSIRHFTPTCPPH